MNGATILDLEARHASKGKSLVAARKTMGTAALADSIIDEWLICRN